jgi:hypothetical protein
MVLDTETRERLDRQAKIADEGRYLYGAGVTDNVVLVLDKNMEQYGRLARITLHDWRESGDISLLFADASTTAVHDSNPQILRFYRHFDKLGMQYDSAEKPLDRAGPMAFIATYLLARPSLGGLVELDRKYKELFNESFGWSRDGNELDALVRYYAPRLAEGNK